MNIHSLARLSPFLRQQMVLQVEQGRPVSQVAASFHVSRQTAYKWLKRWRAGDDKLEDRSSQPRSSPTRMDEIQLELIRLMRFGRQIISVIAAKLGLVRSTVGRHVRSMGLGRLKRLEEPRKIVRYEHQQAGQLLHLDVKKLRAFDHPGRKYIDRGGYRQRGASRVCLHVCVDDYSRYAYVELLPTEDAKAVCGFLQRAVEHFAALGVQVQRILTDNAMAYRGHAMRQLCQQLGIKQSFTRPYRPQTNGKAERFIRSASQEWADVFYENSSIRDAALPAWVEYYNQRRPHHALNQNSPASRLPKCQQPVET